jgi:hypothetical protein
VVPVGGRAPPLVLRGIPYYSPPECARQPIGPAVRSGSDNQIESDEKMFQQSICAQGRVRIAWRYKELNSAGH